MDENQIKNVLVKTLVEFGYRVKTFDEIINDNFFKKMGKAVLVQSKEYNDDGKQDYNNFIDSFVDKYFNDYLLD